MKATSRSGRIARKIAPMLGRCIGPIWCEGKCCNPPVRTSTDPTAAAFAALRARPTFDGALAQARARKS